MYFLRLTFSMLLSPFYSFVQDKMNARHVCLGFYLDRWWWALLPKASLSWPVPDTVSSWPVPDTVSSWPVPDTVSSWPVPNTVSSWPVPDTVSSWPVPDTVSSDSTEMVFHCLFQIGASQPKPSVLSTAPRPLSVIYTALSKNRIGNWVRSLLKEKPHQRWEANSKSFKYIVPHCYQLSYLNSYQTKLNNTAKQYWTDLSPRAIIAVNSICCSQETRCVIFTACHRQCHPGFRGALSRKNRPHP